MDIDIDPTIRNRFWDKVQKSDSCWIWVGARDKSGYGSLHFARATGRRGTRSLRAHRISYELHFGSIGDKNVCHRCDNPPCVRPDHLFLGTDLDNCHDMLAKGRGNKAAGERNCKAKLTNERVEMIRQMKAEGSTLSEIATSTGMSKSQISAVVRAVCWVDAPGPIAPDWKESIRLDGMAVKSQSLRLAERHRAELRRLVAIGYAPTLCEAMRKLIDESSKKVE